VSYPECPDCRTPQLVPDESVEYTCFTCFCEEKFARCGGCGYAQTVSKRWTSFTCGRCERKVDPPRSVGYSEAVKARESEGVGYPYPKL